MNFKNQILKDTLFLVIWLGLNFLKDYIGGSYSPYVEIILGTLLAIYLYSSGSKDRNDLGTLILGIYLGFSFVSFIQDFLGKEEFIKHTLSKWKDTTPFNWGLVIFIVFLTYRLRNYFKKQD